MCQSGCFPAILMLCHSESDILLRYMFPVAEKKEDDSWQRNPGGVWMATQDKVGTGERFCFIRSS